MKAVRVVGYHTKLHLADVPAPRIRGPLDVVVKIGGAGVCRTDLHIGHENAGWVTDVGSAVTNVTVPTTTCRN